MIGLINDTGIVVLLVGVVLLFGASRIPKLARNLGEASKEFKHAHDDDRRDPASNQLTRDPDPAAASVTISREQLDRLLAASHVGLSPTAGRPGG